MMSWLFRRRSISSILKAELHEALLSFHVAAAAKEDWKSRKAMLRERITRLRHQITLAKAEEAWKSSPITSSGLSSSEREGLASQLLGQDHRHTSASPAERSGHE